MPQIKLQSSNGEIFPVDLEIARLSSTIKTMVDDLGLEEDDEEIVPLPHVNSKILRKVIQWATHHKNDPPSTLEGPVDDISSWDANFVDVDQTTLFELIVAANYLHIKGLLELTSKAVANMIKGKSAEEMRQIFNIDNDFTPEEERQMNEENELCL